jgi:hypothetical protein
MTEEPAFDLAAAGLRADCADIKVGIEVLGTTCSERTNLDRLGIAGATPALARKHVCAKTAWRSCSSPEARRSTFSAVSQ